MAKIRITNLRLRTIIGANDWERDIKQNVIINITIDYDAAKSGQTDKLEDTIDYKAITKKVIALVESSNYFLLEKLAEKVLESVLDNRKVGQAHVRIDKPGALRFADSVSVEIERENNKKVKK